MEGTIKNKLPSEVLNTDEELNLYDHLKILLTTLTSMIPTVGGPLSILIDKYIPERRQQRLYNFMDDFFCDLKSLEEKKVDKDYLQSEEFGYLLEQSIIYISKSYQKEKIKSFKNILLHSLIDQETSQDVKEIYLSLVDELTELDIIVLKKINEGYEVGYSSGFNEIRARREDKSEMRTSMFELLRGEFSENGNDWKIDMYSVLLHLVSKNLITERDLVFEHYKKYNDEDLINDEHIISGEFIYNVQEYMTSLGAGFVDFIRDY